MNTSCTKWSNIFIHKNEKHFLNEQGWQNRSGSPGDHQTNIFTSFYQPYLTLTVGAGAGKHGHEVLGTYLT